jgi:DNA-binding transcriptional MerR regulator
MMQISHVAKQTGVSIDAIRFYERVGVLKPAARSTGGFRLYLADDVSNVRLIRKLQSLGFSLDEIREFLQLRITDMRACAKVKMKLNRKLRDVRMKRAALVKIEAELMTSISRCRSRLGHMPNKRNGRCPVLTSARPPARSVGK